MILNLAKLHAWLERKASEEERRRAQWHFWFAWRPKVIMIGSDVNIAWLSTIARRRVPVPYSNGRWEYGPITNVVVQPK